RHASDLHAGRVENIAPDELVMTIRALRKRAYRRLRHMEVGTGKRLGRVHGVDSLEPHDRTAAMKPHLPNRPALKPSFRRSEKHDDPRLESLVGEVGLRIDDHLATIAVRPSDSPDQEKIVHALRGASRRPGIPASPWSLRAPRSSRPASASPRPCAPA